MNINDGRLTPPIKEREYLSQHREEVKPSSMSERHEGGRKIRTIEEIVVEH
jgi:hypothetical protein